MHLRLAAGFGSALLTSAFLLSHAPAAAQGTSLLRAEVAVVGPAPTGPSLPPRIVNGRLSLIADRDDDDVDGTPDGEQQVLPPSARADLVPIDPRFVGATLSATAGAEHARLVAGGKVVAWGSVVTAATQLQGVSPGQVTVVARSAGREEFFGLDVFGVAMRDGKNAHVDLARSHASLERTPPTRVDFDAPAETISDPDALRIVITSPEGSALGSLSVESTNERGVVLDSLRDLAVGSVPCSKDAVSGARCVASAPIRFVSDDSDRLHSLVMMRSVRAELGGAIVVRDQAGRKLQAIRVEGPRASSIGPINRHKLVVHPIVMRLAPGGAPAVGGTDAGAVASIRQELDVASSTWGQCGISFGPSDQTDVRVVNPPPPYLIAVGNDSGLPASGGEVRLRIDGKAVAATTKKDWSTRQVSLELQKKIERAGFVAQISENARIAPGATASVDVLVKRHNGGLANVELVSSSDATLSVTIGAVDLTDGLQHFGDTDSVAGTIEERTLVKAVEDGDPSTIEVIVIPFFSGGGRIGESFIGSDGSSIRNVVILDRAGVRARRTSLTLAHELGHVILDEPGHPDDYGVDTPTLLMDSDASDSSPFGPRRLTVDECTRAVRQSGPRARIPLLSAWKLSPIKLAR